jgi:hypothetical protein
LTHPQLCAYVDQELAGPSLQLVQRHLGRCESCHAALVALEAQDARLLQVIAETPSASLLERMLDTIAGQIAAERPGKRGKPLFKRPSPAPRAGAVTPAGTRGPEAVKPSAAATTRPETWSPAEPIVAEKPTPAAPEGGRIELPASDLDPPVGPGELPGPSLDPEPPPKPVMNEDHDPPETLTARAARPSPVNPEPVALPRQPPPTIGAQPSRPGQTGTASTPAAKLGATLRSTPDAKERARSVSSVAPTRARFSPWYVLLGAAYMILTLLICGMAFRPDLVPWLRGVGVRRDARPARSAPAAQVAVATPSTPVEGAAVPGRVNPPADTTALVKPPAGVPEGLGARSVVPRATVEGPVPSSERTGPASRGPTSARPSSSRDSSQHGGSATRAASTAAPRKPLESPTSTEIPVSLGLLCGEVRDREGRPVAGAQVMMADLGVVLITDRSGRFCLAAPVGDRTLSVLALGFTPLHQPVSVRKQNAELVLTLDSATPYPLPK